MYDAHAQFATSGTQCMAHDEQCGMHCATYTMFVARELFLCVMRRTHCAVMYALQATVQSSVFISRHVPLVVRPCGCAPFSWFCVKRVVVVSSTDKPVKSTYVFTTHAGWCSTYVPITHAI